MSTEVVRKVVVFLVSNNCFRCHLVNRDFLDVFGVGASLHEALGSLLWSLSSLPDERRSVLSREVGDEEVSEVLSAIRERFGGSPHYLIYVPL